MSPFRAPIRCGTIPRFAMLACAALLALSGGAHADTIYKSPGGSGPVYSDQPSPGGRAVNLPPPNIAQPPPKAPPATPESAPEKSPAQPQAETYRSFRIVYPEHMGSAAANLAAFEVRVVAEPPLQTKFGHVFTLKLNGRPVGKRYLFAEMLVPPEFFGDTLDANQTFHLEAFIEDRDGKVLMTAKPVDFTMRFMPLPPRRRH